jgi:LysR family glycine cleavage system transcriptional activator
MNERNDPVRRLVRNTDLLVAIGRELNFTRAAESLGLEQSAVSHRVKTLEEAIGMKLFERSTRKLEPTEVGQILCETALQTVEHWDTALKRINDIRTSRTMRLSVSSSLAMKWIVPSLHRAQEFGLDLAIDVDDRFADLHRGEAQAAVRYGRGPYPGLHSERLCDAALIPVARPDRLSPALTEAFCGSEDARLLVDSQGETDQTDFSWRAYFTGRGWRLDHVRTAGAFNRADLALQAAIGGMGIALGRTLLIENDLKAGLLEIVGAPVPTKAGYWLVTTPSQARTEGFETLRDWLSGEVSLAKAGVS